MKRNYIKAKNVKLKRTGARENEVGKEKYARKKIRVGENRTKISRESNEKKSHKKGKEGDKKDF